MTVINKYILREVSKFTGMLVFTLLVIYLAVDFFENIEDFLKAKIPIFKTISFFFYKIPFIIAQMLPLCALLAIIVVFGLMNKNNEMLALKSGGVSNYKLLWPVLAFGFGVTTLIFVLSEFVVPFAVAKANRIWLEDVKGVQVVTLRERNVWIKGNRRIIHIKFYKPKTRSLHGITVYDFDASFNLSRRLDARRAIYRDPQWVLLDVMSQDLKKDSGHYEVDFHPKMIRTLDLVPEDFNRVAKQAEEMGIAELMGFIHKIETEGYDATSYRVDLHNKIAMPFVSIILCTMGLGIATRHALRGKLPITVSVAIGIAFVFWTIHSLSVSLGYGEMMPPLVAVWATNVFGVIGAAFLLVYTD